MTCKNNLGKTFNKIPLWCLKKISQLFETNTFYNLKQIH